MITKFEVITLFPDFYNNFIDNLIYKKALKNNLFQLFLIDLFKFSKNGHVDDYSYGGGEGMVLKVDCLKDALDDTIKHNKSDNSKILKVLLTPKGKVFNHRMIKEWHKNYQSLILITGHYEDYDGRFYKYVDELVSIGDFVLSNGDIVGTAILDALIRQIPRVINDKNLSNESFDNDLLDFDHFTRPYNYNNDKVDDVLVNGNHKLINNWRYKNRLIKTYNRRKDLLTNKKLTLKDKKILLEYFIKQKKTKNHD